MHLEEDSPLFFLSPTCKAMAACARTACLLLVSFPVSLSLRGETDAAALNGLIIATSAEAALNVDNFGKSLLIITSLPPAGLLVCGYVFRRGGRKCAAILCQQSTTTRRCQRRVPLVNTSQNAPFYPVNGRLYLPPTWKSSNTRLST